MTCESHSSEYSLSELLLTNQKIDIQIKSKSIIDTGSFFVFLKVFYG